MSFKRLGGKRFAREFEDLTKREQTKFRHLMERNSMFKLEKENQFPTLTKFRDIPSRPEQLGFVEGDEVYIASGPKKGTVTTVVSVVPSRKAFILRDGGEQQLLLPDQMLPETADLRLTNYPLRYSADELRLVGTLLHEDGTKQQFVAKEFGYKGVQWNEEWRRMMPHRVVSNHHEEIRIPWPTPREPHDSDACTPEEVVLKRTHHLTLFEPPVPQGALDSIRNKKQPHKQRTLTAQEVWRLLRPTMPADPRTAGAAGPEKPRHELTQEMKEHIGKRVEETLGAISDPVVKRHLEQLMK